MNLKLHQSVKASAPAKVNLALRVGALRPDGFHPLDTVFEALDIFDDVEAQPTENAELTMEIHGIGENLPIDDTNLVIRAAKLLQQKTSVHHGAHLVVTKRIPVAGGMAGGSADAAATLIALNALWQLKLSQSELIEIGKELGSDIPFALLGGIARGISRGDELTPIIPKAMHGWVILTNPEGLSTPQVFHKFDEMYQDTAPSSPQSTAPVIAALATGSVSALIKVLENDLWHPAAALRPDLAKIVCKIDAIFPPSGNNSTAPDQTENPIQDAVDKSAASPRIGRILSGSGPSIAILCEVAQVAEIAALMRTTFPELTVVSAMGPAAGAHLR
ncbi:4-(cytidine 5'-diphospho)-2-C-methyl-D-erythritol kinase [Arcanobacterium hippocoleae]|uniref:4-(cytidine 5'-diphospho)-2-C-methyl-D-erythritol kinase n=1 Tax=Arcanobacterium hippocoleae TaxID=149017 RepID=UPI00333F9A76